MDKKKKKIRIKISPHRYSIREEKQKINYFLIVLITCVPDHNITYWFIFLEVYLLYEPQCLSVGLSVGLSVESVGLSFHFSVQILGKCCLLLLLPLSLSTPPLPSPFDKVMQFVVHRQ